MKRPTRVLEIRSVRGIGGGPEKTILLGAAQADPARYHVIVCYLRDLRDDVFGIEGRAAGIGVDYTEIRERHSFDLSVWPALRRLVRERQIDIVHSHDYKTDLLAWLLHRRDGVRVLATAHGWSGFTIRERRLYYPGDKRILARLPRVVAVSPLIRDELTRYGADPARVSLILNGIDPEAFKWDGNRVAAARSSLALEPGSVVLGSVGRLEVEKRYDILIEVFGDLYARRPELRLVIAGEGSLRPELEALITRRGLNAVCRLVGHVDDVGGFYHALNVFVQTSDTEGTPNAVLEAMALRTPVVATAAGGTVALMTDGIHGLIVPVGSRDALTAALDRTISDPAAAAARADASRTRVEQQLSFKARMAALEAIYDELMAGPATRVAA